MEQIKLNTIPSGVQSVCHISQFDNTSRIIRCHLFNGSDPLTLTGSETIRLFMRKSDNSRAEFEIESASGSFIDLAITSEMSDIAGDSECKFQITDSEKTIGTLNFKMIVESDAYGDSLKTRSISGPIATFETDLAEDLIKLDVDLEPVQDLHGYDNPWPAGGGVNVLDFAQYFTEDETITQNGVTATFSKGYLKVTGTNTSTTFNIVYKNSPVTLPAGTYIMPSNLNIRASVDGGENTNYASVITAETSVAIRNFYVFAATGATVNYNIPMMLVKGTTRPTEYTPYSNICPISGHDSAQLFRINKNLLEKPFAHYSQAPDNLSEMFFIKAGTYIVAFNETNIANWRFAIRLKDINGNNLSADEFKPESGMGWREQQNFWLDGANSTRKYRVLNIVKDCYIRILFGFGETTATTVFTEVQLELGSTATDYEPYVSEPTPVTVQFGQTIYKGKLYSEQRKVLVTHVCETFDGSSDEQWTRHSSTSVRYGFRIYFQHDKKPTSQSIDEMLSSTITLSKSSETASADDDIITCRSTTYLHKIFYVFAPPSKISTVEELRAFLANEPETVMYPLAEPFYIDLTQIQIASIESSPVASFETTLAMPLNTSEHSFSCSQAEGTPTPDSPIPITGVSEITAYRTGKNLLDKNSYEFANSGNIIWGGAVGGYADGSFILPSGTYTLSSPVSCAGLYISDNEKSIKIVYNKTSITFTLDKTTPIRMMLYINDVTKDDILSYNYQLELGSTATEYEPYSGESITVSLGGTYYGGKLVQSEDGSRKIVLSYAQLVLSSANANIINRVNANKYRVFNADCGAKITGSDYADIKCNKMSSQTGTTNDNRCYINSTGDIRMNFASEYDTVADMIAAIESITVVYPLADPIEVSLPDGDPLTTIAGENNVYCNTGDTALTYYYNMVADPIRIPALVGTNNVYSDAGDVDVEYYTTLEGGND